MLLCLLHFKGQPMPSKSPSCFCRSPISELRSSPSSTLPTNSVWRCRLLHQSEALLLPPLLGKGGRTAGPPAPQPSLPSHHSRPPHHRRRHPTTLHPPPSSLLPPPSSLYPPPRPPFASSISTPSLALLLTPSHPPSQPSAPGAASSPPPPASLPPPKPPSNAFTTHHRHRHSHRHQPTPHLLLTTPLFTQHTPPVLTIKNTQPW